MRSKWVWALLAATLGAAISVAAVLATAGSGLTTTILAKTTFDNLDLRGQSLTTTAGPNGRTIPNGIWLAMLKTIGQSDVYVVDNKLAPGGTTGWHSHPGPSLIFVISGTVTNYMSDDPSCTGHPYSAGEGFVDEGGADEHTLRNEGTTQAETIAVQFLPTGADRRIDEPAPQNCPF